MNNCSYVKKKKEEYKHAILIPAIIYLQEDSYSERN